MRDVYSNYWLDARDKKYGFMEYDRHLCELLMDRVKPHNRLMEVAIGTGYPIADFLAKNGLEIHGIDLSPALVQRCRELNPDIHAKVGDAEKLEYADGEFDATYCFHSTWYFPDLTKVIDEMLRVTREGGFIAFDIQNRDNPEIAADYDRRVAQVRPGLLPRMELHARNIAKVVLRRGNPNWHGVVYEVPTFPGTVIDHLRKRGRSFEVLARLEQDQSLQRLNQSGPFATHPRLVFVVQK
jgi:SAM-dependent methyltransferase